MKLISVTLARYNELQSNETDRDKSAQRKQWAFPVLYGSSEPKVISFPAHLVEQSDIDAHNRRRELQRAFVCRVCGGSPDAPMLRDDLWATIRSWYPACRDLLCIACTEKALGRHLEVEDLKPCLANRFTILLAERMSKGER